MGQSNRGGGAGNTLAQAGRESIAQSNNYRSQTMAATHNNISTEAFAEGSPVEILLFGFKKNSGAFATSFNASQGSESQSGNAHVVAALKHIIKFQNILQFKISTIGSDGRRLYSEENTKAAGGLGKLSMEAGLQTKIQVLLDQRKPPNEEVPSLCDLYDDDLNPIESR